MAGNTEGFQNGSRLELENRALVCRMPRALHRASERGGPGPGALGGLAGRHRGEILVSR